jgi:hypothetical protein
MEPYVSSEWRLARVREALPAPLAFPALDIISAFPGFHRLDFAVVAGHY